MYLIAEFQDKEAAANAIRSLKAGGIGAGDLDLFSEEPVEFRRGVLDRPSRMSVMSVSGGVAGGLLATAFVYFAQHNYRVMTGGMPTFSFWATGVITYEMTMLGAIVVTFLWFLSESGLVRKRDKRAPVPQVAPGSMCLRARCGTDGEGQAMEAMRSAGASHIERRADA
jgi:Protein of unknown function (DUF3341)